jgi:ribonucleoside-triphosphate reductase
MGFISPKSGTGERGIFNLSVQLRLELLHRRYAPLIQGTNPCGEIMLRDMEFCNLSEVVVREDDDLDTLLDKVETATWLGSIQSTFTRLSHILEKSGKRTVT